MHTTIQERGTSAFLARLPDDERKRITAVAVRRQMRPGTVLYGVGDVVEDVYFPITGLCSLVVSLADGMSVEVAGVGREGVVGAAESLGDGRAVMETMWQIAGAADIVPADVLRAEASRSEAFREALGRHAQVVLLVAAHTSACNRLHDIEQRAARWLCEARDRVEDDTFGLTQEFFAMMLGAHRPTVSLAAGALAEACLIEYHRGMVTILDRPRLEALACECRESVRRETARLLDG